MEIFVNEEKIDFTLEQEKFLGEVIKAVESWLYGSHLILTSIKLGDRELLKEPESQWHAISVDQIETLNLSAKLVKEVQIANIETVLDFLQILTRGIKSGETDRLTDLLTGSEDMLASLRNIFKPGLIASPHQGIRELETLLTGSSADTISQWPEGVKKHALGSIDSIKQQLIRRLTELTDPRKALSHAASKLETIRCRIEEVSVLLQTGEEKKAMAVIVEFSDLSQRILAILSGMDESGLLKLEDMQLGGKKVRCFFSELNGFLKELIEAFRIEDFVLVGDLLEYEIAPRLKTFSGFIREIDNRGGHA